MDAGNLTPAEYEELAPHFKELAENGIIASNEREMRNSSKFSNTKYRDRSDATIPHRAMQGARGIVSTADGIMSLINAAGEWMLKTIGVDNPELKAGRNLSLVDIDEIRKRFGDKAADSQGELLESLKGNSSDGNILTKLREGNKIIESKDIVKLLKNNLIAQVGEKEANDYLKQADSQKSLTAIFDYLTSKHLGKLYKPQYNDVTGENAETIGGFFTPGLGGGKALKATLGLAGGSALQHALNRETSPQEKADTEYRDLGAGDVAKELIAGVLGGGLTSATIKRIARKAEKATGGLNADQYNAAYDFFKDFYKNPETAEKN